MKVIVFALFIAPMFATGQTNTKPTVADTIEVVQGGCNCIKSVVRYRDETGKLHDVWLDKTTSKVFIVVPYMTAYRRKYIDGHLVD